MNARNTANRSSIARQDRGDKLKDEVYRQMLRLEANRRGADLDLATALLHGWLHSYSTPEASKLLEWLSKVSPICLSMIEARRHSCDVGRERLH